MAAIQSPKFPGHLRHTKIIATLGPATESEEKLTQLIMAGVDVVRLNMAHGTAEWVIEIVDRIRRVSDRIGRHVAVMMDIKGPEIRTGFLETSVHLAIGDILQLVTEAADPNLPTPLSYTPKVSVSVNYLDLPAAIEVGQTVLVDSGLLRLKVLEKTDTHVACEVQTPGKLSSRRHINLPGVLVNLPALTEKDLSDLQAGIQADIDFVALSFVRTADDVMTLKNVLAENNSQARIIAKIEDQSGVKNMESIVQQSDAIMVARGDLGIEINFEELPLVQSRLVRACQAEGKPVIIATHLLESMIESPLPTRAEVSDVSNAVREQVDAVMLSGETTTGAYPVESVEALVRIIRSIEPSIDAPLNDKLQLRTPKSKLLRSSAILAQELGHSGVVVFTRSGYLPYVLGALRPRGVPIYAFTDNETLFHQLLLPWGVEPFLMPFNEPDPEQTIKDALAVLRDRGWCRPGTTLGFITNVLAHGEIINTLQLREVPESP